MTFIAGLAASAAASTIHVDGSARGEVFDGVSRATAFRTIQAAADLAQAGDEIVIHPGVYLEKVVLKPRGRPEAPVVLRADKVEKNRVIISGAAPEFRRKGVEWRLEDPKLKLYSRPYAPDPARGSPTRILYSHIDLYPYSSLEGLKAFVAVPESKLPAGVMPGPRHGFFHDRERGILYMRLHDSGRYGSSDPKAHEVAVSPWDGAAILVAGDGRRADIRIEGITFETPGEVGVEVDGSHVTVERCWFVGCVSGVKGGDDVTVAYSDYSQHPAWDDAIETGRGDERISDFVRNPRKTLDRGCRTADYESGLTMKMGANWRIHHNYLHDAFEGLGGAGMTNSVGAQIHYNVFERILDNAIETEHHAREVHIYRNVFIDNYAPFSYQPAQKEPWPGPIAFRQNLLFNSPEHASLWKDGRAIFKLIIVRAPGMVARAPGEGLVVEQNTVVTNGALFAGSRGRNLENMHFRHNIFVTDYLLRSGTDASRIDPGLRFESNVVAPYGQGEAGPAKTGAGAKGLKVASRSALQLDQDFLPAAASPVAGGKRAGVQIGAVQSGGKWYPFEVGPLARE